MSDSYQTLGKSIVSEYRSKGSKFLGYGASVSTEEEIKQFLYSIHEMYPKATHHCYAYRLGKDGKTYRANDDGEPSGTAGRPILGQIDSKGLTNTMVIIVRFYGGTKLGVPGLIQAYKECTRLLFEESEVIEKLILDFFQLTFSYEEMNVAMRFVKACNAKVIRQEYDNNCQLFVSIRQSEAQKLLDQVKRAHKLTIKHLYSA